MTKTNKINIYEYYSGLIQLINQKDIELKKYKDKVLIDLHNQPNQTKIVGDYKYSIRPAYNKFIINAYKLKLDYPEVYKQCIKLITISETIKRKRIK